MEGILQEAKTTPSVNYADKYFSQIPNDARFGSVCWNRIAPTNGGNGRDLASWTFILPKKNPPNVYLVIIVIKYNYLQTDICFISHILLLHRQLIFNSIFLALKRFAFGNS